MGHIEEAKRAVADHLRSSGANLALAPAYLNVLPPDHRTDPVRLAREILERKPDPVPNWRNGWYRRVLEYHAGRLSATELLHQTGPSRTNLCEAHFVIGLTALGRGNRAEAKEQFTKCIATNVYDYAEYLWSRSFLACIDDPTWFPWAK
jgi:lipoprotein NlpI